MSQTEQWVRESLRLRRFLEDVERVQCDSDGVASEQSDTIAQQRHLGLLPRVPLRCPGVDG